MHFVKKFKLLVDRFSSFFHLRQKIGRENDPSKEKRVTVCPRSLNPGKAISMAICPNICLFYYLVRALMHDVACEFGCAVGCAETISTNVLKLNTTDTIIKSFIHACIQSFIRSLVCYYQGTN